VPAFSLQNVRYFVDQDVRRQVGKSLRVPGVLYPVPKKNDTGSFNGQRVGIGVRVVGRGRVPGKADPDPIDRGSPCRIAI